TVGGESVKIKVLGDGVPVLPRGRGEPSLPHGHLFGDAGNLEDDLHRRTGTGVHGDARREDLESLVPHLDFVTSTDESLEREGPFCVGRREADGDAVFALERHRRTRHDSATRVEHHTLDRGACRLTKERGHRKSDKGNEGQDAFMRRTYSQPESVLELRRPPVEARHVVSVEAAEPPAADDDKQVVSGLQDPTETALESDDP